MKCSSRKTGDRKNDKRVFENLVGRWWNIAHFAVSASRLRRLAQGIWFCGGSVSSAGRKRRARFQILNRSSNVIAAVVKMGIIS